MERALPAATTLDRSGPAPRSRRARKSGSKPPHSRWMRVAVPALHGWKIVNVQLALVGTFRLVLNEASGRNPNGNKRFGIDAAIEGARTLSILSPCVASIPS